MKQIIPVLAFLFLAWPAKADTLLVSFETASTNTPPTGTINGSFVWDTSTETFSDINITNTLGFVFLQQIESVHFVQAGDFDNVVFNRPVGSITFLVFPAIGHSLVADYNQHAGFDTPLEPFPGTYGGQFWLNGLLPLMNGEFTVTEAPVATPEPSTLLLLAPLLLFALKRK